MSAPRAWSFLSSAGVAWWAARHSRRKIFYQLLLQLVKRLKLA
jgi:hypothetical protein